MTVTLPVPTNGQWTVNFCVTSTNNGGTGLPYVGHGVLVGPNGAVPGTYWNALSGSQLTSSTSYRDNGSTVSGITLGSTGYPGNFSSLASGTTNNVLLDTFAQITPTNVFVFHNVPSGRYNLALYGCVGSYVDRGITFTVNGVSQSVTNVQDVSLLPDNTVIYTNLLVLNGSLEVDMTCVTNTVLHNPSTEGDFNGAQIQLVKYGTEYSVLHEQGRHEFRADLCGRKAFGSHQYNGAVDNEHGRAFGCDYDQSNTSNEVLSGFDQYGLGIALATDG